MGFGGFAFKPNEQILQVRLVVNTVFIVPC